MGNSCSATDEINEEAIQNRKIHKMLMSELRSKRQMAHRLILFGPGSSGKSTVFKQARIAYDSGFTEQELESYKSPVHSNLIDAAVSIIQYTERTHPDLLKDLLPVTQHILSLPRTHELTPKDGEMLRLLWFSPVGQIGQREGHIFSLLENAPHLMSNTHRICARGYIPTEEDVLRCRVRTSGITETKVTINDVQFVFVDVGGQRGERRKWIHLFDCMRAMVFVAAVSEYDQVLVEDGKTNRLMEALTLYEDVSARLPHITAILLLNKVDLLKAKFEQRISPLENFFPEYEGGWEVDKALEFIAAQFEDRRYKGLQRGGGSGSTYKHFTTAIDGQLMRTIFESVRDDILHEALQHENFVL